MWWRHPFSPPHPGLPSASTVGRRSLLPQKEILNKGKRGLQKKVGKSWDFVPIVAPPPPPPPSLEVGTKKSEKNMFILHFTLF